MDSSVLKIVLRVQTHGSIAGAARALDLDPSSVSRVVGVVEAALGIRLFHRTTRKLTVTEEGRQYLNRIAPVLEELDAAKEEANGVHTQPAGLLRMTASMALSYEVIVPLCLRSKRNIRVSQSICAPATLMLICLKTVLIWRSDWHQNPTQI